MSLSDRLRAVLADAPEQVVAKTPDLDVWRIDDPAFPSKQLKAEVRACRRALLDALAEEAETVYLELADDPEAEEIPGSWIREDAGAWRWPPDLELDDPATARWLMVGGNWTAYSASAPVEGHPPNPFRTSPKQLLAWMREAGVHALVAVFPDGVEWVAAVA